VLLRPVRSMIEFKQIVGRGTRLFDGKDYFTIYDFVEAHHHFSDPEWDGEPAEPPEATPLPPLSEPQPCFICGQTPCECPRPIEDPCLECGYAPCRCGNPHERITRIKLADGKVRQLQSMVSTYFYSPDGRPISAEQFLQGLFGTLPELFGNEDE